MIPTTPTITGKSALFVALTSMFRQQEIAMEGFKEIEQLPDAPLPLYLPNSQRIMRDFAWRTTEELSEAYTEYLDEMSDEAFLEELSDATHFLIEMMIFAGVTPGMISARMNEGWWTIEPHITGEMNVGYLFWLTVDTLGEAMHILPHKPWKKTMGETNEEKFRYALVTAFHQFCLLWGHLGLTLNNFHDSYFLKSKIVKTRQETGY